MLTFNIGDGARTLNFISYSKLNAVQNLICTVCLLLQFVGGSTLNSLIIRSGEIYQQYSTSLTIHFAKQMKNKLSLNCSSSILLQN